MSIQHNIKVRFLVDEMVFSGNEVVFVAMFGAMFIKLTMKML